MATDRTIIARTSPWPREAGRLVQALAGLPEGGTTEDLVATADIWWAAADVMPILDVLASLSICRRDGGTWHPLLEAAELLRLATLLLGAALYRELDSAPATAEIVVTMPMAPSRLAEILLPADGLPSGFLSTDEAFLRIAREARTRFVIMTPFLDTRGFDWARTLFAAADQASDKVLVLRNFDQHLPEIATMHREWITTFSVRVLDYHIGHEHSSTRQLPIETFHAKIVLCDRSLGYIGSANFLRSSRDILLEAGTLVRGASARKLADLVEAVVVAARPA